MHHVVSDGWSMGVLLRELSDLYGAFRDGGASPLADLPVQYGDFALWQRAQLDGEALAGPLAWWTERLSGAPELLQLPSDRPRPAVQSYRGAQVPIRLSAELSERLEALGRREGATPYMVLLGAFQVLLSRYAAMDDVVVGSTIAGRTRVEVEGLVGLFMNTLVLRTDLGGDPDFREVLRRVRAVTVGAYEHQEVPFERLVDALRPERTLSHAPLFQVLFELHDTDGAGPGLPGVAARRVDVEARTAKVDLALALRKTPRGLAGGLTYATDLFDAGTARRMVEHLERVLEQVAAHADRRLSRLELMGRAERARVLEWNRTTAKYPADRCIHHLFEAQAARTPDAVAVTFGDDALTYRELDEQANRLAHHLRRRGAGPEVRVGICLERSLELMVGILGVMKAGGAYVPVDPAHPAERIGYVMADAGCGLVLTQARLRASIPVPGGVEVIDIDAAWERIAEESAEAPETGVTAENLAYVIYTSGSTGRPKGVAMHHRGVVNYIHWGIRAYGADQGGGSPVFSSMAVDLTITNLLPLFAGRTVRLLPEESPVEALAEALRGGAGFGMIKITPVHLSLLTPLLAPGEARAAAHTLVIGADFLSAEPTLFWQEHAPGVRLMNEYGPTETVVGCSAYVLPTGRHRAGPVPVGRPIQNLRFYVLDPHGEPVPVGLPGELFIAGAGVARGYLGRPGLSAEKFVPDPFALPGERMYRTGDRARWLADGNLMILGRTDNQVKIRGYRVELGEIEAVLRRHPAVSGCMAVVREDVPGDRRLVAYVVADGADAEAGALRAHLRRSLPEYMVPGAFVMLDALPRTATGKIDPRTLPAPEYGAAGERHLAPRTPVEEVLAELWAGVLHVDRVGAGDDFFARGGHSILATRLVSRVRDVFGVELPLRTLFEGPTVAEMAERVEALRRAAPPSLPPVVPVGRDGPLPLSFAQERLWFLSRMEPESPFYNVPAALRLGGALDAAALERALGQVVRRHEALRTTLRERDGAPVQVVAPFAGFALPVEDLSALAGAEREAAVRRRASEEAARPFDLPAGPLFRARLLRLADDDHALLLCMHHVVSDGWSMGVLFRELSAFYAAGRGGVEGPPADLPVQYADHAVWQRDALRGDALDGLLAWWRERLAGAPALLELPTDHPRPAAQSYRGGYVRAELPAALVDRLRALGRAEGATLYMVLLAAFKALLSRYGGGEDVVVGSTIAGRTRGEVEGLIGLFMNTLALRTDLSGDPDFRALLRRVRGTALDAYEHQALPFEKLVTELRPERTLSHAPVFQVLFELNDTGPGAALDGLEVRPVEWEAGTAKLDLTLALRPAGGGLAGGLVYSTDLFERGTIERMLAHLRRVLEQVAADADVRLSELRLADEAEHRRVVETWNGTAAPYPAGSCIHQLFEAQAARTPDAIAVTFGADALTYRELDARANRLAHHLRRRGVGPEVRVGICLERSPELMVCILGVMKAGGAYVPVDPAHPAERIGYVMADAGCGLVLTQARLRASIPPRDGVEVIAVDTAWERMASESAEAPETGVTSENLAYVIYTSGSTGRPKGVAMHHRGVANYIHWGIGHYGADRGNGSPVFSSMAVDLTITNLLALFAGRPVHFLPEENAVEALAAAIRARPGYGALKITPVHLSLLTPLLTPEEAREAAHTLVIGADFLPAEPTVFWQEHAPGVRLMNEYGPTETVVGCSAYTLPNGLHRHGAVPVGGPIQNLTFYVLDGRMRPVPIGVPGELYIGGAGVARGYLGRPGLSAERFVPDPFAGSGARMYRTGDRARWLEGGSLTILGRTDSQVKIRGYRVELGEIEAVLRRQDGVSGALVVLREDAPGDQRLVAYVVSDADPAELRERLRRSLPEYMVPGAFVRLESLPKTATGKIDPRTLPAPNYGGDAEAYVAPRTPVEEVLAGIWAEVLGVERVGVNEGFFDLGGHSLLATRVVSRVRDVFGVELPLRALFAGPTVAEMAERVEALRRAGLPQLPPVVPVGRDGPLPLSFAQERLWFLSRMEPENPFYNVPAVLRLGGALDAAALERALGGIVRRHESLRTALAEVDGTPVQVIAPFTGFALPVEDLSALDDVAREAVVLRRASEDAARPFDLSAGPPVRVRLLRLADDDHALLLCMHHVVTDGWSMGVLFRELWALYAAHRDGTEPELAGLPVQYADYAVWQREQLRGEPLERELAYWKGQLAGAPALLELPTDHPRPAAQAYGGAYAHLDLPAELAGRLRALGRREGATLYMVLLAAFQVLLSKYAGSADVVVGSPVAGRTRREVEELIGFFVNTLVLRTDLGGDPDFREVLRRVRETALGAQEHQQVPFEKLVAELQPERSLSHAPLVQVTFALNDGGMPEAAPAGLRVRSVAPALETAKFDLSLTVSARGDGLRAWLGYATALFEPETIRRMLGHLARVLEQAADDPGRPLSSLSLLRADERRMLLSERNRTDRPYPADVCLHERFQGHAAARPDAPALAWDGVELTYAQLDTRANPLAHHLRGLGVRPESRVGVLMERGADLVVSLLAILKAGGAYVPLDPAYPAERLRLMVADAGIRVVVAHSAFAASVAGSGAAVVALDEAADALAAERTDAPASGATAQNLAYIVYTSGSTGRPKGVMVTHRTVVQLVVETDYVELGPGDRVAQASNASFDALAFEAWGALLNGATLVGIGRDVLLSPPAMHTFLREQRITTLYQTTALLNQLSRAHPDIFQPLREVLFGGQAADADAVRRIVRAGRPRRLLHMYGPTETTAWCSCEDVRHVAEDALTVSVGRPTGNQRIYLLDGGLQPVPPASPARRAWAAGASSAATWTARR